MQRSTAYATSRYKDHDRLYGGHRPPSREFLQSGRALLHNSYEYYTALARRYKDPPRSPTALAANRAVTDRNGVHSGHIPLLCLYVRMRILHWSSDAGDGDTYICTGLRSHLCGLHHWIYILTLYKELYIQSMFASCLANRMLERFAWTECLHQNQAATPQTKLETYRAR